MQAEKTAKRSRSTKDVRIPDGPWLNLIEGAAWARMSYSRFVAAGNRAEFPVYLIPGSKRDKRVKKTDIDAWLGSQRAN